MRLFRTPFSVWYRFSYLLDAVVYFYCIPSVLNSPWHFFPFLYFLFTFITAEFVFYLLSTFFLSSPPNSHFLQHPRPPPSHSTSRSTLISFQTNSTTLLADNFRNIFPAATAPLPPSASRRYKGERDLVNAWHWFCSSISPFRFIICSFD